MDTNSVTVLIKKPEIPGQYIKSRNTYHLSIIRKLSNNINTMTMTYDGISNFNLTEKNKQQTLLR
jgi:hypothetical protein